MTCIRPIAIYLPQFHPIEENDKWWGKGFTEWTNVTKAKPLFKGHYQPHLPADLGFYDLRLTEAREAQVALAKQYNIYGFCYYHYWFNGRRVLERPAEETLKTGKPDFPFMFCWANENWTRRWDGKEDDVLLGQEYSEQDDRNHIRALLKYFKDPRYIRVNGKPVFAIYKSVLLPNPANTIRIWRQEAEQEGLELYICRFENFRKYGKEIMDQGFDAAIDFQPFSATLDTYLEERERKMLKKDIVGNSLLRLYNSFGLQDRFEQLNTKRRSWLDYNEYVDYLINNYVFEKGYVFFPGAMPSWDNTARRGRRGNFLFKNANPKKFQEWLEFIKSNYKPKNQEENFVFINAWNEWAEGNHLEPCQQWNRAYLEAVQQVFSN